MRTGETGKGQYRHWEKIKDIVDQLLDIMMNYRQSGHPGGSRSKVHAFITLLLGGFFRWDLRRPEKRFADRFILGAGHTVPLVYASLAVFNEALRLKYEASGDDRYRNPRKPDRILTWEDLLVFRRRGGLSGHAEFSGKTLFLKFNTGPSGHGSPAAAGEALALKRAGAGGCRVFVLEGEGGLTPGAVHETLNSAWGLALDNLHFLVDWNDFGIDEHRTSSVVYGTPKDWFASHGWRVYGTENGNDWDSLAKGLEAMLSAPNQEKAPSAFWFRTRKGRGYGKYDFASHGTPHPMNDAAYWETKREFSEKYGAVFKNSGGPAPADPAVRAEEFRANLESVIGVLRRDGDLVDYLAERLAEIGDSVPEETGTFKLGAGESPFRDESLWDFRAYPEELWAKPGTSAANRAALGKWGAWINSVGRKKYGRPLFLACSADLAGSTNLTGFAAGWGKEEGWGWYERVGGPDGALLPQEITEFSNAGIMTGLAAVNFAKEPEKDFDGFYGAVSTYGSFSYLLYGPFRLYSQLAQDCEFKTGKVLWIAGHSGPETAEDSRTHFGIFSPGVTQLFPAGSVINLYPWEYNEVPVLLGAAFREKAPIVALHLTRPNIEIPDRARLGLPSHFEAARGAYVLRPYKPGSAKGGTVVVQGTSAVAGVVKILKDLEALNVKLVVAASPELFALQSEDYREAVLSASERLDSTVVTTSARSLMQPWLFSKTAEEYALSPDWDNRWRTGGAMDEVLDEARLAPRWILEGIERFVKDRSKRLEALKRAMPS